MKTLTRDEFVGKFKEWWETWDADKSETSKTEAIDAWIANFVTEYQVRKVQITKMHKDRFYSKDSIYTYCFNILKYGRCTRPASEKKDNPRKPPLDPEEKLKYDRDLSKEKSRAQDVSAKYKAALAKLEAQEEQLKTFVATSEISDSVVHIEPKLSGTLSESTAFLLLSDWHLEESVDPDTVYGMNEYTIDICHQRLVSVCQNALKVIQAQRHNEAIKTLVVWFGGDLITGYIHEELMEGNEVSPTLATMKAEEFMVIVLQFFLTYGDFDEIRVVCSPGNHGRTTKKIRVATGYANSYEWMAFNNVARYMAQGKNTDLNWTIAKSLYSYVQVYEKMNRFWHGDNVRYQGGIGGVTIPLIKAVMRADASRKADYNFLGHFHNWMHPGNITINGSLIGYGPYADRIGAPPEPPIQGLQLLSKRYGYTLKIPIYAQ
jgi:hypothetical protein